MDFWVFTNRIGLHRPRATLEHDVSTLMKIFTKIKTKRKFKQIFSVGQARFQMR